MHRSLASLVNDYPNINSGIGIDIDLGSGTDHEWQTWRRDLNIEAFPACPRIKKVARMGVERRAQGAMKRRCRYASLTSHNAVIVAKSSDCRALPYV
jgi:hypothetical protein